MTTTAPAPSGDVTTFPATLRAAAERFGDREAIVDGDVRLTFAQLSDRVVDFARALVARGIEPGDRVGIWAPNRAEWVVAALGLLSARAVLVPVNTRYKGDEAGFALSRTRARLLVTVDGFLGFDYVDMLRAALPGDGKAEPASGATARPVPGLPHLETIVTIPAEPGGSVDKGAGVVSWEAFLAGGAAVPAERIRELQDAVRPEDVSDIFFTSGTTGRPKGAQLMHGQSVRLYSTWADRAGLREGDRYLLVNPLFHTFGYKAGMLSCLLRGATLVPQAIFDVDRTVEIIERERITVVPGPPTLYSSLLDRAANRGADLSSLRTAVTGAAVVPVALVERMRAEMFEIVITAYGLTECCGTATMCEPTDDAETIANTVGRAVPGTDIRVVGPDGATLPNGEPGEVLVRGYNVMRGYFEDEAATSDAVRDGWLHTGDVGIMDDRGYLRITDRIKDMFVVGGFNAYPAEIEQTLMHHEKVSEVAVVGMPDERLGEVGCAFVIPRGGDAPTEDELIAYCRERLANFKVPRKVRIVSDFPRNSTGKVLKHELRAL